MSSDIAIKVEQLSKCYRIYDKPRDRLLQMLTRGHKQYGREFWAMKDVSFEIKKGETVGIIGRNGSGKSTLLQMICGTLNPTSGKITTQGRIAALLELGSGFNPEFTGRENVYMNAAVLGLTKNEINERFNDIVAFADIGDFIEQPVKKYSSGMMVRLAFAVIAYVDADILVVDEALAVGDAVFTQKCIRFIRNFQKHGSLIFVSHDIAAVQGLCKSCIWLKNGCIAKHSTAKNVAEAYLQYTLQETYGEEAKLNTIDSFEIDSKDPMTEIETIVAHDYGAIANVENNIKMAKGWKTGKAEVVYVSLTRRSSGPAGIFEGGEHVQMTVRAKAHAKLENPIIGFLVRDRLGQDLFGENTLPFSHCRNASISKGSIFEGVFNFKLPMLPNGQYVVMASVADGNLYENVQHHWLHDALIINVSSSKVRFGLVGVPFTEVTLGVVNESEHVATTVC